MIWELPTICSSIYSAAQRSCENSVAAMVTVVQLVEHQVVILGVAGSSPVSHPKHKRPELDSPSRGAFFFDIWRGHR